MNTHRLIAVGTPLSRRPGTDPDMVVKPSGSYLGYLTSNRCLRPRVWESTSSRAAQSGV